MKTIYPDRNSYVELDYINDSVEKNAREFVLKCERDFEAQLDVLVESFLQTDGKKILMLAGPSSSGKTTTAFKLSERFEKLGHLAPVVSLDEFFLGLDNYPKLADGSPDMESVYALDVPHVRKCLDDLINKGEAAFPKFDFATSSRLSEENIIKLGNEDLLIIEGIHSLNPILIDELDVGALYRAYISTRTRVVDGDKYIYSPKDARLIRRMIRDQYFRGHTALNTLLKWHNVLEGEEKYIYPYRDLVDFKIDSSLEYEAGVFHEFLKKVIDELDPDNPQHQELCRLIECLKYFGTVHADLVPKNSLLREFIGYDH